MNRKGYFYVIGAAVLWGILPIVGKGLYGSGVDPLTAAAFRATLAAIVFVVVSLIFNRQSLRIRVKDIPFFFLYGLICVFGLYSLYFLAIAAIPISMAAILLYTAPSFVVVLSAVFFKERMTGVKVLSLMVTFVGCVFVVGAYNPEAFRLNLLGILFGLGSGISYAMLSILGKIGLNRYTPWTNMTYTLVFGTVFMWVIRPPWIMLSTTYTYEQWGGFIALAILCTVLPNTLYVSGLRLIEAGQASITATLEPVVATLASMLLFREHLGLLQLFGMMLVLTAVVGPIFMRKS